MWLILFLIQIIGILSDKNIAPQFKPKIISGTETKIESFPHLVMFINDNHLCGATILNMRLILTAAHCIQGLENRSKMLVRGGTSRLLSKNGEDFQVSSYVIHKEYDKKIAFQCDIAMILLNKNIVYSSVMRKARLPVHNRWQNTLERRFLVAGWGTNWEGGPTSTVLMSTVLHYVDRSTCAKLNSNVKLTNDMFCLYGDGERDSCQGDSGGGVVWKGFVVGLVSFGEGCAQRNKPGVYANVFYFRKWIQDTVNILENSFCKTESEKRKKNENTKPNKNKG